MRMILRIVIAAVLIGFPLVASANRDWTGCPSTGTMDESVFPTGAATLYSANTCSLGVAAAAPANSTVLARINVTNTYDNNALPDQPGWTLFELGYTDVDASVVTATLFRVNPCTGTVSKVCTVTSASDGTRCRTCNAAALGPIDFASFLYVIEYKITDVGTASTPLANTLRLY